jgi:hypothetical protein
MASGSHEIFEETWPAEEPPPPEPPRLSADEGPGLGMVAGLPAACGLLFLLFFVALTRSDVPASGWIIQIAILGMLAGIAAAVAGRLTKGLARSALMAAFGAILVIVSVALVWSILPADSTAPAALNLKRGFQVEAVLLGGTSGLLALSFGALVLVVGALYARSRGAEHPKVRRILAGLAILVAVLQLANWMVMLAGDSETGRWTADLFARGRAPLAALYLWWNLSLWAVVVLALVSLMPSPRQARLISVGLMVAQAMLWSVVAAVVLGFFYGLARAGDNAPTNGALVLGLLLGVIGGLVPLAAGVGLCLAGASALLRTAGSWSLPSAKTAEVDAMPVRQVPARQPSGYGTPAVPGVSAAATPVAPPPAPVVRVILPSEPPPLRAISVIPVPDDPLPAVPPAAESPPIEFQLRRLKQLLDEDLITAEDYNQKKRELLSRL